MPKVELVFFFGCPSIERAREAILAAGVKNFAEISQSDLPAGHAYRQLSSPSILVDGEIVSGSSNDGAACSIVAWESVSAQIRCAVGLQNEVAHAN